MKVLIVDDHPMFRRGVREILEAFADIDAIAEADNGVSAIQHLQLQQPDIAIFDLALPEIDGLALLEWTGTNTPEVRCVILTMYDDREYLDRALELGASGYILKDDSEGEIRRCLDALLIDEIFVSPRFGRPRARLYPLKDPALEQQLELLTPLQRTILTMVGQFRTSREIATALGVSVRTVQNHRYAMTSRLGLSGANELLRFATRCAARSPGQ